MEQIIKKSNRLPGDIKSNGIKYILRIERNTDDSWHYMYIDPSSENCIIDITHRSLQACVDETLHALKLINYLPSSDLIEKINYVIFNWYDDPSIGDLLNNPNSKFVEDLKFDSLDCIECIMELERSFNISFEIYEVDRVETLLELYHLINNKLN